jgi:plastocyanin
VSRLARIASLAAAAAVVLAGCGAGAGPTAGPVTPVPSGTIAIEAKENPYSFTPATITVPAGSVTFSVRNAGNEEHEFEILQGDNVVDEIEGIVPGLTKGLTVTLAAGDYTYICKLNGHNLLGMKGTLTVTGG